MDITLDQDLSDQLEEAKPGNVVTLTGTITGFEKGNVTLQISDATNQDANKVGGTGEKTAGQPGYPYKPEEAPAIPGPVKMILRHR